MIHQQNLSPKTAIISQIKITFLEIVFPIPDSEDILKLAIMSRKNINLGAGMAIIIYDRMIGLSILVLLLPLSFLFISNNILPSYFQPVWVQVSFILGVLPLIVYHRWIIVRMILMIEKFIPTIKNKWEIVWQELEKKIPLTMVIVSLVLTFIYALCGTSVAWLLVKAIHGEVSFLILLAGIPLYYISGTLPLSIQGLGLYETALVFVLRQQGINTYMALLVGLLHFIFNIIMIGCGGMLYLIEKDKKDLVTIFLNWTGKLIQTTKNT